MKTLLHGRDSEHLNQVTTGTPYAAFRDAYWGMLAGVIFDTHGYFDERVAPCFEGVDLIFHAGDIGGAEVLSRLGLIAPVLAVLGNNDLYSGLPLAPRMLLELEGHRIQLVHEVAHADPDAATDVLICGHSHKALIEWRGTTLHLNPGAAGRRGFHKLQSVALLRLEEGRPPEAELLTLGPRLASAATRQRSSR